jgi:catechol 2,3-dioxygenase-like lactoylglutathione lyase family enzyme
MIYELNHAGILVSDLDRSLAFYRDALGGEVVFRGTRPEGPTEIVYLYLGSGMIELISGGEPDPDWGHYGLHHLGFMSDALESDFARLVGAGATGWRRPAKAGTGVGSTAFVLDPNGVRVELLERDVDFRKDVADGGHAKALDHYSIVIGDFERAGEFYGELLGMERLSETRDAESGHSTFHFALGQEILEIHNSAEPQGAEPIDHIALLVDSVTDSLAFLSSHGIAAVEGPRPAHSGIGSIAVIRDPDGVSIELLDRPPLREILG